ncbi:MAG: hypothetical protein ACYTHJ_15550 [Planctomycetota bacterium]|jgi:hypothetical protein
MRDSLVNPVVFWLRRVEFAKPQRVATLSRLYQEQFPFQSSPQNIEQAVIAFVARAYGN